MHPYSNSHPLLLLEDDRDARSFMSIVLRRRGFEVFEADDVDDAVHVLETHPEPFSVAVLDLNGSDRIEALIDWIGFHSPDIAIVGCVEGSLAPARQQIIDRHQLRTLHWPFSPNDLFGAAITAIFCRRIELIDADRSC